MTGIVALIKALLPFFKEIYLNNNEDLKSRDRRRKLSIYGFICVVVFLGYLGSIYFEYMDKKRNSREYNLANRLELAEERIGSLQHQLQEERTFNVRLRLELERCERSSDSLDQERDRLRDELGALYQQLRERSLGCSTPSPNENGPYDRLWDLYNNP